MTGSITERIQQIRQQLPDSVRLIAVSKQVPVEAMEEAYAAGVRDFGESRIQEATLKQEQLQHYSDLTWHLIGHLQSNKARKALEQFEWIHSVDNLHLAQRLNQLSTTLDRKPNLCLQVKLLHDPSKFGWSIPELLADLPLLDQCSNLNIRGLMCIAPLGLDSTQLLNLFQETAQLAQQIQQQPWNHLKITELSMGMSDDYLLAVKAGSTMVRLGRTLFGDRT